jgi:putative zinc finger/helix-turn-helix YgiT family protein
MSKGLCSNCEKIVELERFTGDKDFNVRGETIKIKVPFVKCPECGDVAMSMNAEIDPFQEAYREYRKRHKLLQPEEIKEWRKSIKLTQTELSRLLGIGVASLSRYENGSLQDESHDKLIRLTMLPRNLEWLMTKSQLASQP